MGFPGLQILFSPFKANWKSASGRHVLDNGLANFGEGAEYNIPGSFAGFLVAAILPFPHCVLFLRITKTTLELILAMNVLSN
jgi:hypothetical protein